MFPSAVQGISSYYVLLSSGFSLYLLTIFNYNKVWISAHAFHPIHQTGKCLWNHLCSLILSYSYLHVQKVAYLMLDPVIYALINAFCFVCNNNLYTFSIRWICLMYSCLAVLNLRRFIEIRMLLYVFFSNQWSALLWKPVQQ